LKSYPEDRWIAYRHHNNHGLGTILLRHPLTRSCNVTRSQVEIWSLVPFDLRWAGQKVSCQCTLSLVHNCNTTSRLRKTACPIDALFADDGCGYGGVAGFEVGNGRQGAHFRDSRCHGMLQKKGKLSKDARAAASRPCLVIFEGRNACFCDY
jgi:hypothetical protein